MSFIVRYFQQKYSFIRYTIYSNTFKIPNQKVFYKQQLPSLNLISSCLFFMLLVLQIHDDVTAVSLRNLPNKMSFGFFFKGSYLEAEKHIKSKYGGQYALVSKLSEMLNY